MSLFGVGFELGAAIRLSVRKLTLQWAAATEVASLQLSRSFLVLCVRWIKLIIDVEFSIY